MTRDPTARFGELRSLLQQPPSELVWGNICAQLEGIDDDLLRDEVLPYLTGHLTRWPEHMRATPSHWLDLFLRGDAVPQLALCARLWRAHGTTAAEIRALGQAQELERITTLDLVSCRLGPEVVKAIMAAGSFPRLQHLDLSFNRCGDEGAMLIASSPKSLQLSSLRLDQCHITDDGAQALARSPYLSHLDTLTLYNNELGHWGVEELRQSNYLSRNARRPWLFTNEL